MNEHEKKPPGDHVETPWERFQRLTRAIVHVPKEAIQEPKPDKPKAT